MMYQCRFILGKKCTSLVSVVDNRGAIHVWGEGNGSPLQYSWLENPTDGGAL